MTWRIGLWASHRGTQDSGNICGRYAVKLCDKQWWLVLCGEAQSLGTADKWFKSWMTKIFAGTDWKSGRLAVVLTADEEDRNSGNAVLTLVIHPSQKGHVVSAPLTRYSLTRLFEEVTRTSFLNKAATAPSMAKAFGLPITR